jgi:hypothetical protein
MINSADKKPEISRRIPNRGQFAKLYEDRKQHSKEAKISRPDLTRTETRCRCPFLRFSQVFCGGEGLSLISCLRDLFANCLLAEVFLISQIV